MALLVALSAAPVRPGQPVGEYTYDPVRKVWVPKSSISVAAPLTGKGTVASPLALPSVGLSKITGWPVCPAGQVLTVHDAGSPTCTSVTAAAPAYPACPSGQFLTSDGGLLCSAPPAVAPLPGCAAGEYVTSDGGASLLCSALPAAPAAAGVVRTTGDITLPPSSQATPKDLTGLTWPVASGAQSSFECFLPVTVTGATNGPRFTLTLASATGVYIQAVEFKTTAIAAVYEIITATGTYTAAVTSGATAGAHSVWQLRGTLTAPASASTAQIKGMASNGADAGVGNGLVVRKGAWCWFY